MIVPKAQFAMTDGQCCIQVGSGGAVSPPAGPGQSLGGGPGGEGPGITEDLAFYNIRNGQKQVSF